MINICSANIDEIEKRRIGIDNELIRKYENYCNFENFGEKNWRAWILKIVLLKFFEDLNIFG